VNILSMILPELVFFAKPDMLQLFAGLIGYGTQLLLFLTFSKKIEYSPDVTLFCFRSLAWYYYYYYYYYYYHHHHHHYYYCYCYCCYYYHHHHHHHHHEES
ncbi:hypothetical protein ACJX0J_021398, partial [Zea mays]